MMSQNQIVTVLCHRFSGDCFAKFEYLLNYLICACRLSDEGGKMELSLVHEGPLAGKRCLLDSKDGKYTPCI